MAHILTKQERRIAVCYIKKMTTERIAGMMGISQRRVQQILQSVRKKMPELFEKPKPYRRPKTVRYESWMDDRVKERF